MELLKHLNNMKDVNLEHVFEELYKKVIVVNVNSKEESDEFIELARRAGLKIEDSVVRYSYSSYENKTCYNICFGDNNYKYKINYGTAAIAYKSQYGYKVMTFKEFKKRYL